MGKRDKSLIGENKSLIVSEMPKRAIHFSRRKISIVIAICLILIIAGITYFVLNNKPKYQVERNPTEVQIENLVKEGPPKEDLEKVSYYAWLSSTYEEAGDNRKALDAMQKADTYIADRSLATGRSVNMGIARLYEKLGDTGQARQYYQRELERLKNEPDTEETRDYIQSKVDGR